MQKVLLLKKLVKFSSLFREKLLEYEEYLEVFYVEVRQLFVVSLYNNILYFPLRIQRQFILIIWSSITIYRVWFSIDRYDIYTVRALPRSPYCSHGTHLGYTKYTK